MIRTVGHLLVAFKKSQGDIAHGALQRLVFGCTPHIGVVWFILLIQNGSVVSETAPEIHGQITRQLLVPVYAGFESFVGGLAHVAPRGYRFPISCHPRKSAALYQDAVTLLVEIFQCQVHLVKQCGIDTDIEFLRTFPVRIFHPHGFYLRTVIGREFLVACCKIVSIHIHIL